jgi:hypothetical protein
MLQQACRVYLHDPAAAAGYVIPSRYKPKDWQYDKYAQELWLREALLAGHPWRVSSPGEADLILIATDFSMLCVAHKMQAARHLWQLVLNDTILCNGTSTGRGLFGSRGEPHCHSSAAPKLLPLTDADCMPPWHGWSSFTGPPSKPPHDFLFLFDHKRATDRLRVPAEDGPSRMIVSPAVVARPAWLTGESTSSMPKLRPWSARKLLFFAGHIPKLYINKMRYRLWVQLHDVPGVTCVSSSVACTVGAYEVCSSPNRIETEHTTFCESNGWRCRVRDAGPPCAAKTPRMLRNHCRSYKGINWTTVAAAARRDSRTLPHHEYLALAHEHRFCLAAPGDFVSTPKISEFIAIGAVGGCIPVIVVPDEDVRRMLPYADTLNYCAIAFLVRRSAATTQLTHVLSRLANVSAEDAAAKTLALRRARDAFVWRTAGGVSAVDHILSAACTAARNMRRRRDDAATNISIGAAKRRKSGRTAWQAPGLPTTTAGAAGELVPGGDCLLG